MADVRRVLLALVVILAVAVFWMTAYPTITWWDSSGYSLAAATLGVTSPPGSLLLILLGRSIAAVLPNGAIAHGLNLFAGALAGVTVAMVYLVGARLDKGRGGPGDPMDAGTRPDTVSLIGGAFGALTFAFSTTLWEHGIKFTPYILSAVFTGMIWWTMVRWWRSADHHDSWRWIALLTLLFGLDFSVHRTNALLIPGAIAWILIRNPRAPTVARNWVAGVGGLFAGLSLQLLVIPIAATTRSPINMSEPRDWSSFWDYISLSSLGGGFLVDLWPRNASLVGVQVADFARVVADNILHVGRSIGPLGALPAFAIVIGIMALYRRDRRLGIAFISAALLQACATVIYFNIPADYFRPFDRHYLPTLVTLAIAMTVGLSVAARRLAALAAGGRRRIPTPVAIAALGIVPAAQLIANWHEHNASRRFFTLDVARNALATLPPNAIYFTAGDNDTFPAMWVQTMEGVRRDVTIINLSLANTDWHLAQLMRRDSTLPTVRTGEARAALTNAAWTDTTLVVPVGRTAEQLGLPASTTIPSTVTFHPRPSFGTHMTPGDVTQLDLLVSNQWRRPITFAITVGDAGLGWFKPYARLEGLHWRIIPVDSLRTDADLLRANLARYEYRGYADSSMHLELWTRIIGTAYLTALDKLIDADLWSAPSFICREDVASMLAVVPPERLAFSTFDRHQIEGRCRVE